MKKDVRRGFILWVGVVCMSGFLFTMFLTNLYQLPGDVTLKISEIQISILGGFIVMLVLALSMWLDKKVKDPSRRVYR